MTWTRNDSITIYDELVAISATILKRIGCLTEPYNADRKTIRNCQFRPDNGGKRQHKGILYHYTGGVSMAGALAWANNPGNGNTGSSWHAQIADRMLEGAIGEEWDKIDDELRKLFPVPTIILADHRYGTWHGNWTCDVTLGVENRNGGYWGYNKAKGGLEGLGKQGVEVNGRIWEEYTREQIVCNINYGRMANGLVSGSMDEDWVMTHQCVYALKSDCGPVFPIHDIRKAIFSDDAVDTLSWLAEHPMAPDDNKDYDEYYEHVGEPREPGEFVKWVKPSKDVIAEESDQEEIRQLLYRLGYNSGAEADGPPDQEKNRKLVKWFQRSTHAYKTGNPGWVLDPDGICGPKTMAGLKRRMKQMGYE